MNEVFFHGPVFDGRAALATEAMTAAIEQTIAEDAVNQVKARLGEVLQHPTGFYESHIQTERSHEGDLVTDGGVVYGPWLEGVGSRNQTTRFKGYFTFRQVAQKVEHEAEIAANETAARYVEEMR